MIAEPQHDTPPAIVPPVRDERSMLVLQLAVAGLALVACLLVSLAR